MKAFALDQKSEVEVIGLAISSVTKTAGGKLKVVCDDANFKIAYIMINTQRMSFPRNLSKGQSSKN